MSIILFSPLGNHDPIAATNYYDGSMLHIVRYHNVDKVILYMSKEILDFHRRDNRFIRCLDKMGEMLDRKIEYEVIERPDLEDVHDYDYFFAEFSEEIRKIKEKMKPEDTLLLNVSSGTPAMKNALFVIQHFAEYEFEPIQVATPKGKSNYPHGELPYPVDEIWEKNNDNLSDAKNRSERVKSLTLLNLKNQEIIKNFISSYDYHSACVLAERMSDQTRSYINLLMIARDRMHFRFVEVDNRLETLDLSKEEKKVFLPQKDQDTRKYFEYALLLDVKRKRQEYADFIRAISPLLADLFELILKEQCGIDANDFAKKIKNVRRWDEQKLKASDVGQRILGYMYEHYNQQKSESFKADSNFSNEHFKFIIVKEMYHLGRAEEKADVIRLVGVLRAVETKIRNFAAHEIIEVSDEIIREKTGHNCIGIMREIKKAFEYAGIDVQEDWDSYERMNEIIISKMEQN